MGEGARGVNKFALMVSAIRCNCAVLGGGRLELTDFGAAQVQSRQVDQGTQAGKVCTEKGASVGAGVRYSNICIDRLGGQRFKLAISRRGARARTFNKLAPPQVECDESGAFGEWLKRPWG